jgi:lipoate-protein ligase A
LALEEAILNAVDRGDSPDSLRLWESPTPFVVLGVGQKFNDEVRADVCEADGVPIVRRCSAGGCVIQGPGCLNYSLFLTYDRYPQIRDLRASYRYLLGALTVALRGAGIDASQEGISDLAVGGMKISGNAQKRKRRAILHHGTLLYRMDGSTMGRYLKEPALRPEYRGRRPHESFVKAINTEANTICELIAQAFAPSEVVGDPSSEELAESKKLTDDKYSTQEWTRRR